MERGEKIGLGIAVAGHALLLALLSATFLRPTEPLKLNNPPMDVSIVDKVALLSAAPNPSDAPPPAAKAPEQSETPEEAAPAPKPELPKAAPAPAKPAPKPAPKPEPRPTPKPVPAKAPPPPKPAPAKPAPAKPAPAKPAPAKPTPPKAGTTASGQGKASATRAPLLGDDFLKDLRSKATSNAAKPGASGTPAATIGPAQVSALNAEIRRQLRPFWKAPSGADAELLRTVVSVNLARDGSLVGAPEVVDTTGITPSNQGQVKLHREQAIKAIRLAAPFKLPPDLYAGWKSLRISFDKRLSQ